MARSSKHARDVHGILLLNKPSGISSNLALQKVKRLFQAKKAGHTGSLDPLATGMLPICLGEATKLAGYMLGHGKSYVARAAWGSETDTDDADGEVIRHSDVPPPSQAELETLLPKYLGDIMQRPPIYSALKREGERLYLKARRGETVEVEERPVRVDDIQLLGCSPQEATFDVTCGSGTYIRSLVRDIGQDAGCLAHISALHRSYVEPFATQRMFSFEDLAHMTESERDAVLLPIETGLVDIPHITLSHAELAGIVLGQSPAVTTPLSSQMTHADMLVAKDPEGIAMGLVRVRHDKSKGTCWKGVRMFHAAQRYVSA